MKLEFDSDMIRNHKITLLDGQIDLVLKSLELYHYNYQFIYPYRGNSKTLEENLRINMVTQTYEQILSQFNDSKSENPILENFKSLEKNYKKIAWNYCNFFYTMI